ncbi:MAG: hypothetical protein EHM40_09505 [Chloroflexi bacterium]|nr:MAG: hypothetical protein EHM40_09505 [Chloroflexota bacterium]
MMQRNSSHAPQQPSNPALERLGVFIGEWNTQITSMSFDPNPSAIARGRTSFDWLEAGAFLIQHSEVPDTAFPRGIAVIGPDDAAETYGMLYFDSRGVSRIYQMSLHGNVWKIWRDFPGFPQRFIGTFSGDHNIITARWEKSGDGSNWELDFNLTYTRVK